MHEDKPNALWCWWYFRKECFSGFVLKQPYVQWLQFEFTQLSSSWVLSLKNNIQSFGSFGFGTKNVLNILCAYWKLTGNKLGFDKCEFYIRKKNTKPNKKPRNEIEDKIARKLKKKLGNFSKKIWRLLIVLVYKRADYLSRDLMSRQTGFSNNLQRCYDQALFLPRKHT